MQIFIFLWKSGANVTDVERYFQRFFRKLRKGTSPKCFADVSGAALLDAILTAEVFLREYVGGMYDTASYVIAKTAIEALVGFLVILAGIGVCHAMIALQGNFFYFMLTAWAYVYSNSKLERIVF